MKDKCFVCGEPIEKHTAKGCPGVSESSLTGLLSVGDIVCPKSHKHVLVSGCREYAFAVVVSVFPLVLVSDMADMRWSNTVKEEYYRISGKASQETLKRCMRRLGG